MDCTECWLCANAMDYTAHEREHILQADHFTQCRPPPDSPAYSTTHSLTDTTTHSLTDTTTHSLTDTTTHSLTDSTTHSLTDSTTHSLTATSGYCAGE